VKFLLCKSEVKFTIAPRGATSLQGNFTVFIQLHLPKANLVECVAFIPINSNLLIQKEKTDSCGSVRSSGHFCPEGLFEDGVCCTLAEYICIITYKYEKTMNIL
jgi:hypothetical protein